MTADEAMSIVREHGVVLASAKGPVPRLAEIIAGESIKGSWWAHPKSHEIFAIFQEVGESPGHPGLSPRQWKGDLCSPPALAGFGSSGAPLPGKSARAGASRTYSFGPSCQPRTFLPEVGATRSYRSGSAAEREGGLQRLGGLGYAAQQSAQEGRPQEAIAGGLACALGDPSVTEGTPDSSPESHEVSIEYRR